MKQLKFCVLAVGLLICVGCDQPMPASTPVSTPASIQTTPSTAAPAGTAQEATAPAAMASGTATSETVAPATKPAAASSTNTAPPAAVAPRMVIAAASDLRYVMTELQAEFRQRSPDLDVETTFGSSGTLFAQISNQAPFDLFLSADIQYPQKLAEQQLTVPDSLFQYAIGHIVLWVRKDSPLDVEQLGVKVFADPSVKKVAIANPKLAPYGKAAEAALKNLGVYDSLQDKLVLGENISQTAQFGETGAADVAVIALSLAVAPAMRDKGKYWMIPEDAYPRLEQGGVILKNSQQIPAAKAFCEFLQSPEAKVIFQKYGFVSPATNK